MRALRVGDPMDEATDVGPLATEQGRADLEELVDDAVAQRRHRAVRRRGAPRRGRGWYYPPTVLAGITAGDAHPPRGGLRPGRHALPGRPTSTRPSTLANDTPFGLSSNVWTRDEDEQDASYATWRPAGSSSTA